MADYHPLIARAVSGLEKDTAENRRVLYERARTALVSQLRGNIPPLDESEITRERLALEEAIRKVEVESARRARQAPKLDPLAAKRAAEGARREAAERREKIEQAAQPAPPATPAIAREPVSSEPARAKLDSSGVVHPSDLPQSEHAALLDEALKEFRDVVAGSERPAEVVRAAPPLRPVIAPVAAPPPVTPKYIPQLQYQTPPPPPSPPASPQAAPPPLLDALKELESFEPGLSHEDWRTPPGEQVQPLQTFDYGVARAKSPPPEFARHAEDLEHPPRRLRSYRRLIWICIGCVLAFGGGATAYWQRDAIVGAGRGIITAIRGPAVQVQKETTPSRQKITDRIGQPESPQSSKSGPTAAQRAMLTTEPDATNPGGKDYVGSANWRIETIPAGPGRAAEVAIKLEVEIPDRGLTMSWLIRRNSDPTLPASHTIDIEFNMAPNSPLGAISEIRSLLMKQPGQTEGSPLWGHAQKSTPNYFLVGLSATEADAQYNLRLLKGQPAFDVALVFTKVRRAFLLIEKGPAGERVFAEAFAAWKQ